MKSEEDLIKEVHHVAGDMAPDDMAHHHKKIRIHKVHNRQEIYKERRNPWSYILVLVLLLIIIMMLVPYYGVKLDPRPGNIPGYEYVVPANIKALAEKEDGIKISTKGDYIKMVEPNDARIKQMANRIVTISCDPSNVCYAKALFAFVQGNIQYVSDPPDEYIASPYETLYTKAGDCDDYAVLLANLLKSIGVTTRFAFIPNHVFVQVQINDAPKKYKDEDGWINLDPTCRDCAFGEIPYSTYNKEKKFVWLD